MFTILNNQVNERVKNNIRRKTWNKLVYAAYIIISDRKMYTFDSFRSFVRSFVSFVSFVWLKKGFVFCYINITYKHTQNEFTGQRQKLQRFKVEISTDNTGKERLCVASSWVFESLSWFCLLLLIKGRCWSLCVL